jgi:hypothetical protein
MTIRPKKTEGNTTGLTQVQNKTPQEKTTEEKTTQENRTQDKTT